MKKIPQAIYLFAILFSPLIGAAQRGAPNLPEYDIKRFHFGFYLGLNYATFTIKPQSNLNPFDSLLVVEPTGMAGFDIGIVTNMHLGKYFDLRFIPSLSLIDRKVNYKLEYRKNSIGFETQDIESVNLNFPLLVKFKSSRMGKGPGQQIYPPLQGPRKQPLALRSPCRSRDRGCPRHLRLSLSGTFANRSPWQR